MNEKTTERLDKILKSADIGSFRTFSEQELSDGLPSLSDYLNECISNHDIAVADVVKNSHLSKDYAYALLNGNRKNPTKDRIVALCLAIHMSLLETQRALKICGMVLYSKRKRDAALIICINREIYDIGKVNDFLIENNLEALETSRIS